MSEMSPMIVGRMSGRVMEGSWKGHGESGKGSGMGSGKSSGKNSGRGSGKGSRRGSGSPELWSGPDLSQNANFVKRS